MMTIDEAEAAPRARRSPRKPPLWPKHDWFSRPRDWRRDHFHCCVKEGSEFMEEDFRHGRSKDWWMEDLPTAPVSPPGGAP